MADTLAHDLRARLEWIDGDADVWSIFADPELFGRCVKAVVEPFRDDGITQVVAVEARGFILGGASAVALRAGFVGVRKATGHFPGALLSHDAEPDYKRQPTRLRLQRNRLTAACRVLVVDDWFETGAQFDAVRTLIEESGATLVGASVLIDQTPATGRARFGKYRHIASAADLAGA